jgi:hypothetical protein
MTWQEGQAKQYDFYVAELDKLLAELENAEAICEELAEPAMTTETRAYAGGVRALRDTLRSRAVGLRTGRPDPGMPMSITSWKAR